MADENGTQQQTQQQEPKTFTQDEVNELMGKVRRETREKYADYDDLAKKAKAYDEAQEAAKTELEKAREESAKAIDELNALKAEKARSELRQKVSKETGVPADLISGDDEESMTASAQAIADYAKSASTIAPHDKGGAARKGGKSNADLFADALSNF
jgi:chromosome segregation ATPase